MRQILKANPDAIYVKNVRTDSFFWGYVAEQCADSQVVPLLQPQSTGAAPVDPAGRKVREMQRRSLPPRGARSGFAEWRLLQEREDEKRVRVTKESEIDRFLEAAHQISKRTWQYDRGWGLRDLQTTRRKLSFLARRACLRSYLLKCGDTPVLFILGEQYHSRFYTELAGADHRWRGYSVLVGASAAGAAGFVPGKCPAFLRFWELREMAGIFRHRELSGSERAIVKLARLSAIDEQDLSRVQRGVDEDGCNAGAAAREIEDSGVVVGPGSARLSSPDAAAQD